MVYEHPSNAITALVEYEEIARTVRANLCRSVSLLNADTYSVRLANDTLLTFDTFVPVQPVLLTMHERALKNTAKLTQYIGSEIVASIVRSPESKMEVVVAEFTTENRLAIAQLQLDDPSTPAALKAACQVMLSEHGHLDNEPLQQ